jgi:hypothetical protein
VTSFQRTGRRERLFFGLGPPGPGVRVPIRGRDEALGLLRELGQEPWGWTALRRLYAEVVGRAAVCWESDQAVLEGLTRRLLTGEIKAWSTWVPEAQVPAGSVLPVPETNLQKAAADEAAKTWVEIAVVDARTGKPVSSLSLTVLPPHDNEADHTTNGAGVIRIDGIKPGSCVVSSAWGGAAPAATLAFVGMGAPASGEAAAEPEPAAPKLTLKRRGAAAKGGASASVIAGVERHKVRTGETLEGLAKSVGATVTQIAKFNFGTDKPKEINARLRSQVGCRTKTADGKNYVFDDADTPGILLLPSAWKMEGLATGQRHVVQVAPVELPGPGARWAFSM